jgi:hypothetical protein
MNQLPNLSHHLYQPNSQTTLYTFFLPLRHNDGSLMQRDRLHRVQHEALCYAGGLTKQHPGVGFWVAPTSKVYRDLVLPLQILAPTTPETESWFLRWAAEAAFLLEQHRLFCFSQPIWPLSPLQG